MDKINVSIYVKGINGDFNAFRRRKNKANSKPIRANFERNQAPCSLFGLFGGGRVEVLEFKEESVLAADAVKG